MQTNDSDYIRPAMQRILATDPAAYETMRANRWHLTVIDRPEDLAPLMVAVAPEEHGIVAFADLVFGIARAFGVTYQHEPSVPPSLRDHTWLNRPLISQNADNLGVPVVDFLADVLVHEFEHVVGGGEVAAFNAGTKFARKLGSRAIARYSQSSGAEQIASASYDN